MLTKRPVFITNIDSFHQVKRLDIEFTWFPGFSLSQKRKSIESFHTEIMRKHKIKKEKILEISTKSNSTLGFKLSAFNLELKRGKLKSSLESFYQGSKVFDNGGPFTDLYEKSPIESKKDVRLRNNGNLKGFEFFDDRWNLNQDFYSWLYFRALRQNDGVSNKIIDYDAFTDIEFNPKKSLNCQALSAAFYVYTFRSDPKKLEKSQSAEDFKNNFVLNNPIQLSLET